MQSSPPEDLIEDCLVVSHWVKDVFRRYCDQIFTKMVDAASLEGVWLSLRHGAWRYPAVIINKQVFVGLDALKSAETRLGGLLQMQSAACQTTLFSAPSGKRLPAFFHSRPQGNTERHGEPRLGAHPGAVPRQPRSSLRVDQHRRPARRAVAVTIGRSKIPMVE